MKTASESQIQKFTLQVTQATNEQLKANEKIKPLRDKEIESAAKLNRINLERESLDHEEERIKEEKRNLENVIQQIMKFQRFRVSAPPAQLHTCHVSHPKAFGVTSPHLVASRGPAECP